MSDIDFTIYKVKAVNMHFSIFPDSCFQFRDISLASHNGQNCADNIGIYNKDKQRQP